MVEYTVYLYNAPGSPRAVPEGTALGIIHNYSSISVAQVINGYNVLNLTVEYNSPYVSELVYGTVLQVWRQDVVRGIPLSKVFDGMIQSSSYQQTDSKKWSVVAFGYEHVLSYRVIGWDEGKNGITSWTNQYASNIVNDIINYNFRFASNSVSNTERATYGRILGFPSVSNLNIGRQITIDGVAYSNCLLAIQDVCKQGNIDFALEYSPTLGWRFPVAITTLGTDRSDYMIFSIESNSIGMLRVTYDYTQYFNTVIVRGMGSGNSVVRVARKTSPFITGINQRESFVDDPTSANVTTLLDATGDLELAKIQDTVRIVEISVNDQPPTVFGKDYFLGDIVKVDIISEVITMKINGVTMQQDNNNVETLTIDLIEL